MIKEIFGILASILFIVLLPLVFAQEKTKFCLTGDVNGNGIDISDPVYLLNYLFSKGPAPSCLLAADTNGDGIMDLADSIFLLNNLFLGGAPPVIPIMPNAPFQMQEPEENGELLDAKNVYTIICGKSYPRDNRQDGQEDPWLFAKRFEPIPDSQIKNYDPHCDTPIIKAKGNFYIGFSDFISIGCANDGKEPDRIRYMKNVYCRHAIDDLDVEPAAENMVIIFDGGYDYVSLVPGVRVAYSKFPHIIVTGLGNDFVIGTDNDDGGDYIEPSEGQDIVFAKGGDDIIMDVHPSRGFAPSKGNIFYGGKGNDILVGNDNKDILIGDDGSDILFGVEGGDAIFGLNGNDIVIGDALPGFTGGTLAQPEKEPSGNDVISGGEGNDLIKAGGGDDNIFAGSGSDQVEGGEGQDLVLGDHDFNMVSEIPLLLVDSDDVERIVLEIRKRSLTQKEVDAMFYGTFDLSTGEDDNLYAGCDKDIVYGDGGNDEIDGAGGFLLKDERINTINAFVWPYSKNGGVKCDEDADALLGGDGKDTLRGMTRKDIAYGAEQDDTLYGDFKSVEKDREDLKQYLGQGESIEGLSDQDQLCGGGGKDYLQGDTKQRADDYGDDGFLESDTQYAPKGFPDELIAGPRPSTEPESLFGGISPKDFFFINGKCQGENIPDDKNDYDQKEGDILICVKEWFPYHLGCEDPYYEQGPLGCYSWRGMNNMMFYTRDCGYEEIPKKADGASRIPEPPSYWPPSEPGDGSTDGPYRPADQESQKCCVTCELFAMEPTSEIPATFSFETQASPCSCENGGIQSICLGGNGKIEWGDLYRCLEAKPC